MGTVGADEHDRSGGEQNAAKACFGGSYYRACWGCILLLLISLVRYPIVGASEKASSKFAAFWGESSIP